MTSTPGEITSLLELWNRGDDQALADLMELVYGDLRRVAAGRLDPGRDRRNSFCTTELVHETFLALQRQNRTTWQNRSHFFAVAARLVRRIVVEEHRQKAQQKRGSGIPTASLEDTVIEIPCRYPNWVVLDEALDRLAAIDEAAYRVVALRFVLGLSLAETAEALASSTATVTRHWRFARSWLKARLSRLEQDGHPNLA